MSGARRTGRLSPEELDDLLRRPLLARLATMGEDGYPAIVPVWLEWDGIAAWIVARARASFVADIARDPRVCLSVVADDDPDRRAQLFGRAELVGRPGPLDGEALRIARRMAERYEGFDGLAYIDRSQAWERQLIRVEPERIVSWGSAAWHHRYAAAGESGPDPSPPAQEPDA